MNSRDHGRQRLDPRRRHRRHLQPPTPHPTERIHRRPGGVEIPQHQTGRPDRVRPASLNTTVRPTRWNRGTPSSRSKPAIVCDNDGWAMISCSAARPKPPSSTTARKYRNCRASTGPSPPLHRCHTSNQETILHRVTSGCSAESRSGKSSSRSVSRPPYAADQTPRLAPRLTDPHRRKPRSMKIPAWGRQLQRRRLNSAVASRAHSERRRVAECSQISRTGAVSSRAQSHTERRGVSGRACTHRRQSAA